MQDINKAAAEIEKALLDGMYLAVGLGILGFQKAQVLRVELTRQLEAQRGQYESYLATAREQAEGQVQALRTQLAPYESYLATAREQAQGQVQALRTQLADLARGTAGLG
jgi:hypothetical protein